MEELRFKYKKNKNNEIIITGLKTKKVTRIDIPREIDGKKVVSIAKGAFSQKDTVKIITVPDTITSIGRNAFWNMIGLEKLVIRAKIDEIPREMVPFCPNLIEIVIPETVKKIGAFAFSGDSLLENVVIPTGTEIIEEFAFNYCISLTEINFPKSVKSMGNAVVRECDSLKSITCYDTTELTLGTFTEKNKEVLTILSEKDCINDV